MSDPKSDKPNEISVPEKSVMLSSDPNGIEQRSVVEADAEKEPIEKKKVTNWTEEEHKVCLPSKTPIQIPSDAQKCFLPLPNCYDLILDKESLPQMHSLVDQDNRVAPKKYIQRWDPNLLDLNWVPLHLHVIREIRREQEMQQLNPPNTNLQPPHGRDDSEDSYK